MKRLFAVAIGSLFLAPAHVMAADMPAFPADSEQAGQQIEIGNNWYFRGDIGGSFDHVPTLSFDPGSLGVPPAASVAPAAGADATKFNLMGDLGAGYRFNSWFRADATLDYRTGTTLSSTTGGIICPYRADGISYTSTNAVTGVVTTTLLGYLYDPSETCNANFKLVQHNFTGLVNGYIDLPGYWGVTPYVGAGAGLNTQISTGSLTYTKSSDGSSYAADLSPNGQYPEVWINHITGSFVNPQPNIAFAPQNWNRSYSKTRYSLALAGMVGFGFALTPNATLDIGYRYLDLGTTSTVLNAQTGATLSQRNTSQEVRVGIRYQPE
ncbi:MAG: outer membrane beta-barrel protein [Roseiarcus sp.]|jgi:opacity protein-like surface antigen